VAKVGGKSSGAAKAFLAIGARIGASKLARAAKPDSRVGVRRPNPIMTKFAARHSQRVHKSLHFASRSIEAFATIDFFNLDDTAFAWAYRIDGMHAKPAIGNEPRYYLLSHWASIPKGAAH
jgi:hypothetical protein